MWGAGNLEGDNAQSLGLPHEADNLVIETQWKQVNITAPGTMLHQPWSPVLSQTHDAPSCLVSSFTCSLCQKSILPSFATSRLYRCNLNVINIVKALMTLPVFHGAPCKLRLLPSTKAGCIGAYPNRLRASRTWVYAWPIFMSQCPAQGCSGMNEWIHKWKDVWHHRNDCIGRGDEGKRCSLSAMAFRSLWNYKIKFVLQIIGPLLVIPLASMNKAKFT